MSNEITKYFKTSLMKSGTDFEVPYEIIERKMKIKRI